MAKTLWVEISLTDQGLTGVEALEVRHALEEQIEDAGIGDIVGGGCMTDGSACDFEIEADDLDAVEAFLRDLLAHADLLDAAEFRRE
jgi:hypothetical protein